MPGPDDCCGGGLPDRCGCADHDGDGASCDDCDDQNPLVGPNATERCEGLDNDCDGLVDEEVKQLYYADADHDGYGQPGASCDNACGSGVETCDPGLFVGCTAPTITTVSTLTQVKGVASASYTGLLVKSRLVVDADTEISAANWIRVNQGGQIESGPRTKLSAMSIAFVGNGALASPEVTLGRAVRI